MGSYSNLGAKGCRNQSILFRQQSHQPVHHSSKQYVSTKPLLTPSTPSREVIFWLFLLNQHWIQTATFPQIPLPVSPSRQSILNKRWMRQIESWETVRSDLHVRTVFLSTHNPVSKEKTKHQLMDYSIQAWNFQPRFGMQLMLAQQSLLLSWLGPVIFWLIRSSNSCHCLLVESFL